MKTKQIGLIALLAIITLALIACKEDEPPVEKEFTIHLTKSNKDVSLIDKRETPDKSLRDLGIYSKLEQALNMVDASTNQTTQECFARVLGRNLVLEVQGVSRENGYEVVNNKTISFDFEHLYTTEDLNIIAGNIVASIRSGGMA